MKANLNAWVQVSPWRCQPEAGSSSFTSFVLGPPSSRCHDGTRCLSQESQLLCNYRWHLTADCVTLSEKILLNSLLREKFCLSFFLSERICSSDCYVDRPSSSAPFSSFHKNFTAEFQFVAVKMWLLLSYYPLMTLFVSGLQEQLWRRIVSKMRIFVLEFWV